METSLPRKYQQFDKTDTFQSTLFKTNYIGEQDHMNREKFDRSTFNSVQEYNSLINLRLEEDLRQSRKNIDYINKELKDIEVNCREELSEITKDFGNKIISSYEAYSQAINDQRCENLRLQFEIANLIKEKNSLRHDVRNLVTSVRRLETFLGVKVDPTFDNVINNENNK